MECFDKYSIKGFPLSVTERAPVFKDLCFVLFTSNSFLVNNCRISKKTRARLLPNMICFLKATLKIEMFALSLSSLTRGQRVSQTVRSSNGASVSAPPARAVHLKVLPRWAVLQGPDALASTYPYSRLLPQQRENQ